MVKLALSRIDRTFQRGQAFVAFLTAGDGGIDHTFAAVQALIAGGVNLLEIGVPFSDPIADGPIIQDAARRALISEITLNDIFMLCTKIRKNYPEIPLILFSYYNPILAALADDFFIKAEQAGIDGLLIVDCPFEETKSLRQLCLQHQIALIYLIAPTTPLNRVKIIARHSRGFLYYACHIGTTGLRNSLPNDFIEKVRSIKAVTHLPIVAGFGIKERTMAQAALAEADGVVIGSLFVRALAEGMPAPQLTQLALDLNPLHSIG